MTDALQRRSASEAVPIPPQPRAQAAKRQRPVHASFAIAAAASVFLVVSYLRLVVGLRLALVQAGLAQLVFLVLFSYAFFFEGYAGLTVAVGAVLTLFVLMQLTGRVVWGQVFAR